MVITIEGLNLVSFKIELFFEEISLSIGTAFTYFHNGQTYLITNWHLVTGRHAETLKIVNEHLAIPNKLKLYFPVEIEKDEDDPLQGSKVTCAEWVLDLYDGGVPKWYHHPKHDHKIDAVAIPLTLESSMLVTANDESLDLVKIPLRPALDVFVLGFPRGLSGGGTLPIWKRGSIASDPNFELDGVPKFFIDTATREGMSGSPVYAQHNGYCIPEGRSENEAIIGEARRFVGIYSGRVGKDSFLAQLGIVWKESAIQEIIEGKCNRPEDYSPI